LLEKQTGIFNINYRFLLLCTIMDEKELQEQTEGENNEKLS
jgi:hypothetical protein